MHELDSDFWQRLVARIQLSRRKEEEKNYPIRWLRPGFQSFTGRERSGSGLVDAGLDRRVSGPRVSIELVRRVQILPDHPAQAEVLVALVWNHDTTGEAARELGLPAGVALLQGE